MRGDKEEVVTAYAYEDMTIGDAGYFLFTNGLPSNIGYAQIRKTQLTETVHGVATSNAKTGEFVAVRLAVAGTINVKVNWTGDLLPGAKIYPPDTTPGVMSDDGEDLNVLGIYAGAEAIPEANSGARVEVLVTRVAPQLVE